MRASTALRLNLSPSFRKGRSVQDGFARSLRSSRFMSNSSAPKLNPSIVILAGATASGKSRLALEMATQLDAEIVSMDSVKVYSGLSIGNNKASLVKGAEAVDIPVHLVDVAPVSALFSSVEYHRAATAAIADILARGRNVLVVGGTGFYLELLLRGAPTSPKRDDRVANEVMQLLREDASWERRYAALNAEQDVNLVQSFLILTRSIARLAAVDPVSLSRISTNDYKRLARALEIYAVSGKPASSFPFAGCLLKETFEALKRGLHPQGAATAVGYNDAITFFKKSLLAPPQPEDLVDFIALFQQNSRSLARKQYSWLRRNTMEKVLWVDVDLDQVFPSSVQSEFEGDAEGLAVRWERQYEARVGGTAAARRERLRSAPAPLEASPAAGDSRLVLPDAEDRTPALARQLTLLALLAPDAWDAMLDDPRVVSHQRIVRALTPEAERALLRYRSRQLLYGDRGYPGMHSKRVCSEVRAWLPQLSTLLADFERRAALLRPEA